MNRIILFRLVFIGFLVGGCVTIPEYRQFFGYLGDENSGIYDISREDDGKFDFKTKGELNEKVLVYFYSYMDETATSGKLSLYIKITNNHKKPIKFGGFKDELFIIDETGHQYEFDLMQFSYFPVGYINPRSSAETTVRLIVEKSFKLNTFKYVKWKLGLMNSWVEGSVMPEGT